MSQPVVHYDGNYITCYPGSNQIDDGKLNMEFNMARFVTRVSSKNFCIVKPSFELRKIIGATGKPQIEVGVGQCSINGMDLIMSSVITIDAPEEAGEYHLAFKLHRDSSRNVLGDDIYGVTKTFMGVYLTYFNEKPEPLNDPDMLFLGKVTYDGTDITEIIEDEDKYGRLWAEDILCKLRDPKHPDITRIILQDWIYKVPDWYVSKEGDVEYGEIDFMAGRNTEGTYGIHIQATDDNHAEYIMKAPSLGTDEQDKILKLLANNNGIEVDIGKSKLVSNTSNNFDLVLTTPNNISATSDKNLTLVGKTGVVIGSGTNGQQPKLTLKNHKATFEDSTASGLVDEIYFNGSTLDHKIGKAVFRYENSKLTLLSTDTEYFNVNPKLDVADNVRFASNVYIGTGTFGTQKTWLKTNEWNLQSGDNITNLKPGIETITHATTGSGYLKVRNSNDSAYGTLSNDGSLTLYDSASATPPKIYLNNGSYNATLKLTSGAKGNGTGTVSILDITAGHSKFSGDITATGEIRASKVYNAVYNDLAEFMAKADAEEDIQPGDVVYFNDEGKITKEVNAYALAGVVSSEETYGMALGGDKLEDNEKVPVALAGRVYLNVGDLDVVPGDILAVDNNGNIIVVMEENRFTLGKATSTAVDGKVFILVK